MDELHRIDAYPHFASIIHHDMEVRRGMIFEVHTHNAVGKSLDNWHANDNSAMAALFQGL